VDPQARELAGRVAVVTDERLLASEAVVFVDGQEAARVTAAHGSPAHPLTEAAHARKLHDLAGERLHGTLDDPERPAADLLDLLNPG
jgi:hypothetical protein